MAAKKLSPMMQQYMDIKEAHQDCILFFRLGDFYEMFFEDAKLVSRELELTLTGKNCGLEERAPMCGVPFHSADTYIARLIEKGHKVAICEQTEDPAAAKGLVKREVIRIVTPGTVLSSNMLKEKENNYIASIYAGEDSIGLAYCDVSTGEMNLTTIRGTNQRENLVNEIVKINAREVLVSQETDDKIDTEEMKPVTEAYFNIAADEFYRPDAVRDTIKRQFHVSALLGIGVEEDSPAEFALGSLLLYLLDTQKNSLGHIAFLNTYSLGQHMSLDKATIKNLELTETLFEKKLRGSLLGVLDKTGTAMGSRKLKQWIKEPLNDVTEIALRLDAVEYLTDSVLVRNNIREQLKHVYDFERLTGRIACGSANGKDLIALSASCRALPEIKYELSECGSRLLEDLDDEISSLEEVRSQIDAAIVDDPPFTIKEGGLIKEGFSSELDELKHSIADAQNWIAGLEGSERERTGIKNLKVGYNKVFGYYLEVTNSFKDMVPEYYTRKQTLTNAERYITPRLKELEDMILGAEDKLYALEYELFVNVRNTISREVERIQRTAKAIAKLDTYISLALVASRNNYVRPKINTKGVIDIKNGRHPVVEKMIPNDMFIPNDTYLDNSKNRVSVITGPKMAGKSTYMRQTALIVLMAQIGSFVPAEKANIGIADRIFTRVGASDDLASGQSTFMVEMTEVANILRNATSRSLLILDEIGRGTSTFDGLSIAWAVIEYISNTKILGAKTLFATHYHELTELEGKLAGVNNYCIAVKERGDDIVFLRKIVKGGADKSYGIQVAKLAGVPDVVIERAKELVEELVSADITAAVKDIASENKKTKTKPQVHLDELDLEQISLFDTVKDDDVLEELKNIDVSNLTPIDALNTIYKLQNKLKNSG